MKVIKMKSGKKNVRGNTKLASIFNKTNGRCGYCGVKFDPFDYWEISHMIPSCRGGSDEIENLIVCCPKCNKRKRSRTVDEFRDYITEWSLEKVESLELFHPSIFYPIKNPELKGFCPKYGKDVIQNALEYIRDQIEDMTITFYLDEIKIKYPQLKGEINPFREYPKNRKNIKEKEASNE